MAHYVISHYVINVHADDRTSAFHALGAHIYVYNYLRHAIDQHNLRSNEALYGEQETEHSTYTS